MVPIPFFDALARIIDSEWGNIRVSFAGPWEIPWEIRAGERLDYEIHFVEKGRGKFTVGEREYEVDTGSIICLNSLEGNSFIAYDKDFRIMFVTFEIIHRSNKSVIDDLNWMIRDEKYPLKLADPEQIQGIFHRIHREIALKSEQYHFYAKLLLGNLAYELKKQGERDNEVGARFSANNTTSRFINRIIIYLQENYMKNISLEDLGNLVNLHPRYLCTLFKQATGMTINIFLKEIRLEKAKRLLLYTSLNITEIALQVGFNSSQYFSRIFMQCEGTDPRSFRKRIKNI